MSKSVPYIQRDERSALHAFRYSQHSDNPYCMTLLLDFIEMEFGILPVESPGESIIFLPPFVAIVGTALWDTSIWVSLYGEKCDFDRDVTVPGRFKSWRKFHVQNRGEDITRAKELIGKACDNYRRKQANPNWDDMVRRAEADWLENRRRELKRAKLEQLLRELEG